MEGVDQQPPPLPPAITMTSSSDFLPASTRETLMRERIVDASSRRETDLATSEAAEAAKNELMMQRERQGKRKLRFLVCTNTRVCVWL